MVQANLTTQDFPVPSDRSFSIAMYKNCCETHLGCKTYDGLWQPTRLIQISQHVSEPKLRLTLQNQPDKHHRYIALSHCWGLDPMLRLTTQNLHSFMEDIPYIDLPKSFRDCITVSGWIGG
jgi:hypothetical protein